MGNSIPVTVYCKYTKLMESSSTDSLSPIHSSDCFVLTVELSSGLAERIQEWKLEMSELGWEVWMSRTKLVILPVDHNLPLLCDCLLSVGY